MRIYTKTGDKGDTGLFGGKRVSKAADRVEAYGTVDELNSTLGVARIARVDDEVDALLGRIQVELFDLGGELATVPGKEAKLGIPPIDAARVEALERAIDRFEEGVPPLKVFVLPGGSVAAARLHVARCVCRRAERRVVALAAAEPVRPDIVHYLTRLSDLLFTLARYANHVAGVEDVPWKGRGGDT